MPITYMLVNLNLKIYDQSQYVKISIKLHK